METRKVALVLAGGVSLGSYEAGVLTELLYALDTLNQEAGSNGKPRYVLDVMTGSSAGGMTAVLVSRIMMYDLYGRRRHLFKSWVEDVDILKLMAGAPPNALFSKQAILDIASRYVMEGAGEPPTAPASFAPDMLWLSLALSNMHGVDYTIPYTWPPRGVGQGFVSTSFADRARFTISRDAPPDAEAWQQIVQAAIACGNFPFAFRPQPLTRTAKNYPGSRQAEKEGYFPAEMSFLDGGLFNNEPLREAIHLASEADGGAVDPSRLFLLVDPSANFSYHSPRIDPGAPIEEHLKRMLSMVYGESMARDWLRANRVNNEVEWRDALVQELGQMIAASSFAHGDEIAGGLENLANQIVEAKKALFESRYPDDYLEQSLHKIETQFQGSFQALSSGDADKLKILKTLVFVLNNVAGLQSKSQVRLALIGSDPSETAGDPLQAFGGFFDVRWREHDFRVGRVQAHKALSDILQTTYDRETVESGQLHPDYDLSEEWLKDLPDVTIGNADRGLRQQLRDVVIERIMGVLERIGVPDILRWLVKVFFIESKVEELLELQKGPT